MKLSNKRLLEVAHAIKDNRQGHRLADIGTDHAYLPVFLIKEGCIDYAYACDVAKGPLSSSIETISEEQVEDQVIPLLGDGLAPIVDKEVDMISICGMGGLLITEILEAHKELLDNHLFILQANTAIDLLREYLYKNEMTIVDERIVRDKHHIYEIIVSQKGHSDYTIEDIEFGPILRNKKEPLFIEKWERQLEVEKKILQNMPKTHEKYQEVVERAQRIERILEC